MSIFSRKSPLEIISPAESKPKIVPSWESPSQSKKLLSVLGRICSSGAKPLPIEIARKIVESPVVRVDHTKPSSSPLQTTHIDNIDPITVDPVPQTSFYDQDNENDAHQPHSHDTSQMPLPQGEDFSSVSSKEIKTVGDHLRIT